MTMNATFLGYTVDLSSLFNHVVDIVLVASIVLASLFIGIIVRNTSRKYLVRSVPPNIANFISKTLYYIIVAIGFIVALGILDVNLTGLALIGGFISIAIGFASQTVISNLLSGLFLYFDRPLKMGDWVRLGNVEGFVSDISIFSTRIRSRDGIFIRIPNDRVFTETIENLTSTVARRVEYVIGISYADDADEAKRVILNVLENNPYVLSEPEPLVFVSELGDSSVNLEVKFWTPVEYWLEAKRMLLWEIKKALQEAGIEIPFPQRVVWIKQIMAQNNPPNSGEVGSA